MLMDNDHFAVGMVEKNCQLGTLVSVMLVYGVCGCECQVIVLQSSLSRC